MESKELANIISEYAKELKAFKIKVYDLSNIASYSNYAVIVSTTSNRQSKAIADKVSVQLKQDYSINLLGIEGISTCDWILLDYNDVILHIFIEEKRMYYDLDRLWKDQPVVDILE